MTFAHWNRFWLAGLALLFHCHPDCFAQSNINSSQSFARNNTMGRVWSCDVDVYSEPHEYFHRASISGMVEKQCDTFKKYWEKYSEDKFKKTNLECEVDSKLIVIQAWGADLNTFLDTLTQVTKALGW